MAQTDVRSDPAAFFPVARGDNLLGDRFDLPGDFAGDVNLVLLAFEQVHQLDVDTWLAGIDAWQERFPSLRVYELPTLARRQALLRSYIDGVMRAGIPDRAARARTITLFIDRRPFVAALGLPGIDRAHALLVTPTGEVLWRAAGPYDEGAAREMEAIVERLALRAP